MPIPSISTKVDLKFSGCQIFQHYKDPFANIYYLYGKIKLCLVKNCCTELIFDEVKRTYFSTLLQPMFGPNRTKYLPKKIDMFSVHDINWKEDVVRFIKSDSTPTLVVLGPIVFPEQWKEHNRVIDAILELI